MWFLCVSVCLPPHTFTRVNTPPQAPGYFDIIKNPMDLSVMKSKVEGGSYGSWNELMVGVVCAVN